MKNPNNVGSKEPKNLLEDMLNRLESESLKKKSFDKTKESACCEVHGL